jgi:HPt (histidine-containing phosphotransfer) domain-containing protein
VAELEAAIAADDAEAIARHLHKLRGTSAGYGFGAIAEHATRAEAALRLGGPVAEIPAIREIVGLLRDEIERG